MTTLEDLTDNELTVTIEHARSELARLEAEQARRQREQEARALAAYWAAYPHLVPLKDGDKVLVTRESEAMGDSDTVGSINTIKGDAFRLHGAWGYMIKLDASWGEVFRDISVVIDMRRAYLEIEKHSV